MFPTFLDPLPSFTVPVTQSISTIVTPPPSQRDIIYGWSLMNGLCLCCGWLDMKQLIYGGMAGGGPQWDAALKVEVHFLPCKKNPNHSDKMVHSEKEKEKAIKTTLKMGTLRRTTVKDNLSI